MNVFYQNVSNKDGLNENYYTLGFAICGNKQGNYPINADEAFKAMDGAQYKTVRHKDFRSIA